MLENRLSFFCGAGNESLSVYFEHLALTLQDKFPKCQVDIYVSVLENDGGGTATQSAIFYVNVTEHMSNDTIDCWRQFF